jgi:Phage integrase, N-terminal SAM-like domain
VTRLRQIMLEELRRRNYAESTIHTYIHTVEHFSRHFHRPPDQLSPEHIRQYQAASFLLAKSDFWIVSAAWLEHAGVSRPSGDVILQERRELCGHR